MRTNIVVIRRDKTDSSDVTAINHIPVTAPLFVERDAAVMLQSAGIIVVASPAVLLLVFGVTSLLRIPLSERSMSRFTEASTVFGLLAALLILVVMLATGQRNIAVVPGDWVHLPIAGGAEGESPDHFHFRLKFVFDRLSVPFVIMTFVLCGVVAAFASRYMHREPGFHRFFVLFSFFQLGMILSSVSGTIETLFFGWELVGLSSALLVAFFHDRPSPVENGLRVWSVYRVSDAAFLTAALTLHHLSGSGDFSGIAGQEMWPEGECVLSEGAALFVGCLLLVAAAGKSALVPFSGWLPRAMEGPTPSSAVFYGALSVHLGAFLLLRVSPLLEESAVLRILVMSLGLITMVFATMTARVQADVKSSLAFSSLIQVSIIVIEIGAGLRYIALIHIIGHACLRTLQLIRAPSLLRDYRSVMNAIGDPSVLSVSHSEDLQSSTNVGWYRFAFERGNLDSLLDDYIVRPVVAVFMWSDRMERRWTSWLSGTTRSGPR